MDVALAIGLSVKGTNETKDIDKAKQAKTRIDTG